MKNRKYFNSSMVPINDFNKKWFWPPQYISCDCGEIITKNFERDTWTCPKCHSLFKMNRGMIYLSTKSESEPASINMCPKCGSNLVKRQGRYGSFWGCSNFPQCDYTQKITK